MNKSSLTFVFISISILTFILGSWQLFRLNWKNDLMDNINNSIINPDLFSNDNKYNNLVSVKLDKNYTILDKPIFIESKTFKGKPGYHLILPLKYNNEIYSVINFGWFKDKDFDQVKNIIKKYLAVNNAKVYIREFNSDKPFFTPENNLLNNTWYSVNKDDFNQFYKYEFPSKYYFVLLDDRITKYSFNPLVFLRNNHLNYSITWFLLSLSSVIMLLIIRKKYE
jgi:surfeit locus 1 family protein